MSDLLNPWKNYMHILRAQIRGMMRAGMPLLVETGEDVYEPRILSYRDGKLMSRGTEIPSATVRLDDDKIFIFLDEDAEKLHIGLAERYCSPDG